MPAQQIKEIGNALPSPITNQCNVDKKMTVTFVDNNQSGF